MITITGLVSLAAVASSLVSLVSAAPSTVCPPTNFDAVKDFNLEAYLGTWYVQAQANTQYLPESQNYCVKAECKFESFILNEL